MRRVSRPELAVKPSSLRRSAQAFLLVGAILSTLAAMGPDWLVRAGVLVALISGISACLLAWREQRLAAAKHAQDELATLREHGRAMSAERQQHLEVLSVLQRRNEDLRGSISRLRGEHADRLIELNSLRGDKSALRSSLDAAADAIAALRERVGKLEAELADGEKQEARVLALPRRFDADADDFPAWSELELAHLAGIERPARLRA